MHGAAPNVSGEKYSSRAPLGTGTKGTYTKSTFFIPFLFPLQDSFYLIGDEMSTPECQFLLIGKITVVMLFDGLPVFVFLHFHTDYVYVFYVYSFI